VADHPDIPALVARLEALAHRYDMTHTERYEADSEAFYAATGYMAPGKDVPMAMGGQNEQERRAAHEAWIAGRNMEQQYAIRDAAAALSRLTRERDEAQAEDTRKLLLLTAERHQRATAETALAEMTRVPLCPLEDYRQMRDRAEQAERERDEARAQLAAYEKAHEKARP
jgi:hypothetical protein